MPASEYPQLQNAASLNADEALRTMQEGARHK
jgi:hypothetical protein